MKGWRWMIGFFRFSRREINGIKVLFFIMAAAMFFPYSFRMLAPSIESIPESLREEVNNFMAFQEVSDTDRTFTGTTTDDYGTGSASDPSGNSSGAERAQYFEFDPNDLELEGWLRLGFSERQASMILNYRNKGGRFYQKEDLQKIYAISAEDYLRVADYVRIHGRAQRRGTDRQSRLQGQLVELNGADSLQLQLLPGIGPAFASRIVRLRDRLGGFHDLRQLMEVYGMDEARLQGFAGYVELDLSLLRPIRINESDQETLGRHPLIGYKLAGILVRYREHHGPFKDEDDLKAMGVFDEEKLQMLNPYLIF